MSETTKKRIRGSTLEVEQADGESKKDRLAIYEFSAADLPPNTERMSSSSSSWRPSGKRSGDELLGGAKCTSRKVDLRRERTRRT